MLGHPFTMYGFNSTAYTGIQNRMLFFAIVLKICGSQIKERD